MADKKAFVLRIDENLYKSLEKWAADEFRSVNGQIEWLIANTVESAWAIETGAWRGQTEEDLRPGAKDLTPDTMSS